MVRTHHGHGFRLFEFRFGGQRRQLEAALYKYIYITERDTCYAQAASTVGMLIVVNNAKGMKKAHYTKVKVQGPVVSCSRWTID